MNVAEQADLAERFRGMHHGRSLLLLPNAWDALSARIFAAAGFAAIATTRTPIKATDARRIRLSSGDRMGSRGAASSSVGA